MPGLLCSVLSACLCTIPATPYRNQTVRLSASLRAGSSTTVQFSVAVDGLPTTHTYTSGTAKWTRAEATLPVGPEAKTITLTITPAVQVKDLTLVSVPFPDNPLPARKTRLPCEREKRLP
jgi:hypothetical protein